MWKRIVAAVVLALSLSACKDAPAGPSAFIQGGGNVRILDSRIVGNGDSAANLGAGNVTYVLAHVELTNSSNVDFIPDIGRFYFTDKFSNRAQGIESGSTVFIGISNSKAPLKSGDKHDYYVGFRSTDQNPIGIITYEP